MINLSELEKLAKAATPGPWFYDRDGKPERELDSLDDPDVPHGDIWFRDGGNRTAIAEGIWYGLADNGEFIASMNPTTALALIRVARAAQIYYANHYTHQKCYETLLEEALKEISE